MPPVAGGILVLCILILAVCGMLYQSVKVICLLPELSRTQTCLLLEETIESRLIVETDSRRHRFDNVRCH